MVGSSAFSRLLGRGGSPRKDGGKRGEGPQEEEELGVTEQLREFVKGFTINSFKEFRLPTMQQERSSDQWWCKALTTDGPTFCDDPSTSGDSRLMNHKHDNNVQKDLTEWQERHALLILSTVKEISGLRYVLCPRHLKDKDFWRIYFLLVKNYVAPYEMHAIRKARLKTMAQESEKSVDDGGVEVEMVLTKQVQCAPPTEKDDLTLEDEVTQLPALLDEEVSTS